MPLPFRLGIVDRALMHILLNSGEMNQCSTVAIGTALKIFPERRINSSLQSMVDEGLAYTIRTKLKCTTRNSSCLVYILTESGESRAKRLLRIASIENNDIKQLIEGVIA